MSNREAPLEPNEKPPESRLLHVEERIAWLERHVVEQDRAMMELTDVVQRLKQELLTLRATPGNSPNREADGTPGDADDRPPHY